MKDMSEAWGARRLVLLLGAASAALLAGAWFFELVVGLVPCKLCLQQRLPHYAMLVIALAALPVRSRRLSIGLLVLTALVLAASVALGSYHAGVEWGWFAGPNDCGGAPAAAAGGVQDFMNQLSRTRVVSCTEAAWRFAGLSLAGWNVVASLAMLAAALAGLLGVRRSSPEF